MLRNLKGELWGLMIAAIRSKDEVENSCIASMMRKALWVNSIAKKYSLGTGDECSFYNI